MVKICYRTKGFWKLLKYKDVKQKIVMQLRIRGVTTKINSAPSFGREGTLLTFYRVWRQPNISRRIATFRAAMRPALVVGQIAVELGAVHRTDGMVGRRIDRTQL